MSEASDPKHHCEGMGFGQIFGTWTLRAMVFVNFGSGSAVHVLIVPAATQGPYKCSASSRVLRDASGERHIIRTLPN